MSGARFVTLADRGLLAVSGPDRVAFLQGLVSNDVERVAEDRAVYSAFLTPQGKFLFDFIMVADGERLLLDCEAGRLADFMKRLRIYKLRSKVDLADVTAGHQVHAVYGDDACASVGLPDSAGSATRFADGIALADPRLAALGARLILPADADPAAHGLAAGTIDVYDALRIHLGVPDGSRDMEVDKTVLLEAGFDELNGVDWKKGCYMGQELTARTKYRGLVKRRLVPVRIQGALPPTGTAVTADGKDVGEIRSGQGDMAIAMLRLDRLTDDSGAAVPLRAGEASLMPEKPDWAAF